MAEHLADLLSAREELATLKAQVAHSPEVTFAKHLADEVTAVHLFCDRLGAPKTRWTLNRAGDGQQEVTIGVSDRLQAAYARLQPYVQHQSTCWLVESGYIIDGKLRTDVWTKDIYPSKCTCGLIPVKPKEDSK